MTASFLLAAVPCAAIWTLLCIWFGAYLTRLRSERELDREFMADVRRERMTPEQSDGLGDLPTSPDDEDEADREGGEEERERMAEYLKQVPGAL